MERARASAGYNNALRHETHLCMVVVCVIVCWDTCCINAHQVLMVIGNGFIKFGSRRGHYYQFNDRGTLG